MINPEYLDFSKFGDFTYWYHHEKHEWKEITTIAQHYGTYTRYLDFSFNPYAALFFAAKGAFYKLLKKIDVKKDSDNKFSLWLIHRTYLRLRDCKIKHFEVPTARNRYLFAQRGLFLSPNLPHISKIDDSSITSFPANHFDLTNVVVKNCYEIAEMNSDFKTTWPVMYKFNFPFKASPQILMDLDNNHGINIATLKPNLDNIIPYLNFRKCVKEHIAKTSKQT